MNTNDNPFRLRLPLFPHAPKRRRRTEAERRLRWSLLRKSAEEKKTMGEMPKWKKKRRR